MHVAEVEGGADRADEQAVVRRPRQHRRRNALASGIRRHRVLGIEDQHQGDRRVPVGCRNQAAGRRAHGGGGGGGGGDHHVDHRGRRSLVAERRHRGHGGQVVLGLDHPEPGVLKCGAEAATGLGIALGDEDQRRLGAGVRVRHAAPRLRPRARRGLIRPTVRGNDAPRAKRHGVSVVIRRVNYPRPPLKKRKPCRSLLSAATEGAGCGASTRAIEGVRDADLTRYDGELTGSRQGRPVSVLAWIRDHA